ncbi:alkaline phosphatase-like protein [Choiromyces venosus 120613-1]|uniref:Alkaline phosphatase n=1 Tax=Choiromyces venosus 120613-1 TaxID=1336337 RepID=A0A3N4JTM8_9PEZI|nr:alkaline phosphatase-like protein [Choiromyces venosus 120613-1]
MSTKSLFLIALGGFAALAEAGRGGGGKKPRNFIMVIPDGFGPASGTMARNWVHWNDNSTVGLPIDEMMIGQVRTRSSDSYVTDSASSATAYSCGIKTFNGGIAVNDDQEPCGTVLEAAKLKGYMTGLIVTSRITHATPASYVAHIYDRDKEANIALQEIGYTHPLGRTVDILLGGGKCYFTPKSTASSCRKDGIDALAIAKTLGYTIIEDRAAFDKDVKLPYLGLFTQDHMSYEIDRDPKKEPSLTEMAIKGLDDLHKATKESKEGFFVLVEASRIDHAGHANDPTGHLHDILEYNRAMNAMREWIDGHDDSPTVLISTADHECGGLTLGYELKGAPDYWFAPEYFAGSKASVEKLSSVWKASTTTDLAGFVRENIFKQYGVMAPTDAEISRAIALRNNTNDFGAFLGQALSARLGVNWSTRGHSGVDVTLYGYGINHEDFAGQRENTEVAGFVAEQLNLELEPITDRLRKNTSWVKDNVKAQPGQTPRLKGRDVAKHHH